MVVHFNQGLTQPAPTTVLQIGSVPMLEVSWEKVDTKTMCSNCI
jgi:hypothetical protein